MASEVLIKIPAVSFSQVKGVEMSGGQELALMALPAPPSSLPGGSSSPLSPSTEAALQRASQLEHNIRYLREQHHLMLSSLHKEVEALRQRNRELQFQLVMSSAAATAPLSLLQDVPNSPEDDSRPRVILSPRQPNLSPLQVEILEKDLAELRIDLKEERDKNQHLYGIVQEQQRRIEQLKVVTSAPPRFRDAQCQAGAAGCAELGRKLDDAQRTIRTLRRENDEQRRELATMKMSLSRGLQSGPPQQGRREERGFSSEAELPPNDNQAAENSPRPSTSQHRFPPLHNTGFWQQQQHRPGMEFSGSSRSGHHGGPRGRQHDGKDASSMGGRTGRTTLPALHGGNMFVFAQNQSNNNHRRNSGTGPGGHHFYNNNNNGGNNRVGGYYRGATGGIREESLEGIQGRKYRGGRGQRGERQLQ